tara:strand:- start:67 stop:354 length:288 start_codon:yes stop_codon:yes gene_type:complete
MSEKQYTPKALHISVDGLTYLCGPKPNGSWYERCLSSRFVATLPICEECEEISVTPVPDTALVFNSETEVIEEPETPALRVKDAHYFVSDYRRDA